MMRSYALLPGILSLLLAPSPAQETATDEVVKTGTCFVVHCHGGDETLAERALAAIEPVWPRVAAAFGQKDRKPGHPLEVHLYRTIAGYQAADMRLTNGKFQRNLAMTHSGTNSAHVALQPPCSDEALRAIGMPGETAELLAWEATHVARQELLANSANHPMWLVDGLAAFTAREVFAASQSLPGAGALPDASTDVLRVQRLLTEKRLPPASAILADRIDDLDIGDRYAARAVFFQFLSTAANAPKLAKVLAAVRSTGGGSGYAAKVLAAAKSALGREVDSGFTKYVAEQGAGWNEIYRSLMPMPGGWQQLAFPDKNAIAWNQTPLTGGVRIAGTLRILPGDAQQMNVLFGRTADGDFFSVAFVADQGFTVLSFQAKTNRWDRVGGGNAPALRLGYESAFVVAANGDALHVELDQQHWDFTLPHKVPDAVSWGLGAQAGREGAATGTAGLWGKVTASAPKH